MAPKKNRRRYKRLALKTPIIWKRIGNKVYKSCDAILLDVRNITPSGLFLKTPLKPKKGTGIELAIKNSNQNDLITIKGKVVWKASKKSHPYLYPGVGIKFIDMTPETYKKIKIFINHKLKNYEDAKKLKNMYADLKDMASSLVELEEKHSTASHFRKVIDNAIAEIDEVAHILDREIEEVKNL